jgi:hypothetical protein
MLINLKSSARRHRVLWYASVAWITRGVHRTVATYHIHHKGIIGTRAAVGRSRGGVRSEKTILNGDILGMLGRAQCGRRHQVEATKKAEDPQPCQAELAHSKATEEDQVCIVMIQPKDYECAACVTIVTIQSNERQCIAYWLLETKATISSRLFSIGNLLSLDGCKW